MSRLSLLIIVLLSSFLASSCVTYKACKEKFPSFADTITWRDTVFYVVVGPADTIHDSSFITDTVFVNSGSAGGAAWVVKDTIHLNVWQKDTIIAYRDSIQTVIREVPVKVPCNKHPALNRIIIMLALILLTIIILKIKFR